MRSLKIAFVFLAGALVLSSCSSSKAFVTNMGVADFAKKVAQTGVVTIDVRTPGEYSQGHIKGAINIDVEASTFDAKVAQLDKAKTYAVYCHSGRRSGIATSAMAKAGFTHLYNLENGLSDWLSQGMPVVVV